MLISRKSRVQIFMKEKNWETGTGYVGFLGSDSGNCEEYCLLASYSLVEVH
jgi:hypothetical protein